MLESRTPESHVASIKEAPHWRVVIRPGEFIEERIESLGECWRLIESSSVSLRGWDYPHVDHQRQQNGEDWIESWGEYRVHREYWRFFQSGQFLHLFTFAEDEYRDKAEAKAKSDVPELNNLSPSGYLDATSTLWTITEVFEFAARLAQKAKLDGTVSIAVQMVAVKDRVLFTLDPARDFSRPYMAKGPTLSKEWSPSTQQLLSESAELALDAAEWFFERFQWTEPPRQVLADIQRRLLDRTF